MAILFYAGRQRVSAASLPNVCTTGIDRSPAARSVTGRDAVPAAYYRTGHAGRPSDGRASPWPGSVDDSRAIHAKRTAMGGKHDGFMTPKAIANRIKVHV